MSSWWYRLGLRVFCVWFECPESGGWRMNTVVSRMDGLDGLDGMSGGLYGPDFIVCMWIMPCIALCLRKLMWALCGPLLVHTSKGILLHFLFMDTGGQRQCIIVDSFQSGLQGFVSPPSVDSFVRITRFDISTCMIRRITPDQIHIPTISHPSAVLKKAAINVWI
jgi:hypothetical protein